MKRLITLAVMLCMFTVSAQFPNLTLNEDITITGQDLVLEYEYVNLNGNTLTLKGRICMVVYKNLNGDGAIECESLDDDRDDDDCQSQLYVAGEILNDLDIEVELVATSCANTLGNGNDVVAERNEFYMDKQVLHVRNANSIQVFDLTSKLILSERGDKLDVGSLSPSVYIVHAYYSTRISAFKIVVPRYGGRI